MPRRSGKERLARVQELGAFDQRIALSFPDVDIAAFVASAPACPVESYSTGVPDVSAGGWNPITHAAPLIAQSLNRSTTQLPNPPLLAGFDEAGRGALAGPVVVGCVHFPFFFAALQESVSPSSRDAPVAAEPCPHPRQAVSDVTLLGLCNNVADELPRYEDKARSYVAAEPCPHPRQAVSDVALLGLCNNVADPSGVRLHGADKLPRYENRAESSAGSEPCPHFGQAGSDVPVTDHASLSNNPSISRSLNPSMAQSPDPSLSVSPHLRVPVSPEFPVSLSPRLAFLEDLSGLDDSKRLTARQREALCPRIKAHAVWGIGIASAEEIDKLGIVPAVSLAARRAYRAMGTKVDLLLCDRGLTLLRDSEIERLNHLTPQASDSSIAQLPDRSTSRSLNPPIAQSPDHSIIQSLNLPITQSFNPSITQSLNHSIIQSPNPPISASHNPPISQSLNHSITQSTELSFTRGDSRSLHIAAASIIAKVARDQMMVDLDRDFPGYDFAKHKGYGTAAHIAALRKLGPSAIHRRTFHVK